MLPCILMLLDFTAGESVTPTGPAIEEGYYLTKQEAAIEYGSTWKHPLVSLTCLFSQELAATWATQPAAVTEFLGVTRHRSAGLLQGVVKARVLANVTAAGVAGAVLGVQYSIDSGVTWTWLDGTAGATTTGAPNVGISSTGVQAGAWAALVAGAKVDVWLRLIGASGNGIASPAFGNIYLETRSY